VQFIGSQTMVIMAIGSCQRWLQGAVLCCMQNVVVGKIVRLKDDPASASVLERARLGRIDTSARMFSCQSCDNIWWRRVPDRKKVCRCYDSDG